MALQRKDLVTLGKQCLKMQPATSFSFGGKSLNYTDVQDTFREELRALAPDYYTYQENLPKIFSLMTEIISDVLPEKVISQYGQFAEVKTYAQGTKQVFVQKITTASKRRAKKFITKVGLAGIYEVFKLDGKSFEVPTSAFGGAAQIGFEEFLDGRVDLADVLEIILEGLDEKIYLEIERALKGAINDLPKANTVAVNGFDEASMDNLLAIADSYGKATIYCTYEFAATMIPAEGWASNEIKNQKWNNGYLGNFHGHNVIVLPQSYEDETNENKVIDPRFAWIIPTGSEKPIKVALEGQTIMNEYVNRDLSREIQAYQKFGVVAMITNDICVYYNTALSYR